MNFSEALNAIKEGKRVKRSAWPRHDAMYLVKNKVDNMAHIEYRYISGVRMYLGNSEDLLANDWKEIQ